MLNRNALALAVTVGFALPGCFVDSGPRVNPGPDPGPGTVIVGSGAPRPSETIPTSDIAGGAGAPDQGTAGYIITAHAGIFRITWAGFHEFRGSVFAHPGAIGRLYAGCQDGTCSLASGEDHVEVGGSDPGRIDFVSYPVSGKRSGFDLEVADDHLLLDLLINDSPDPSRVTFVTVDQGGQPVLATAASMPFGLNIQLPQGLAHELTGYKSFVPAPQPLAADLSSVKLQNSALKVVLPKGQEDLMSIFSAASLLGAPSQSSATK